MSDLVIPDFDGGDYAFLRNHRRPAYHVGPRPVRLVDLFSGCGGLTLGVAEAARALGRGLQVLLAVERDPEIWSVYSSQFSTIVPTPATSIEHWLDGAVEQRLTKRERAVRKLVGNVDIMVGGPPCQGHSNLNNHTRGNDPKNALYERMLRGARILNPSALIIENVPALRLDKTGVLERVIRGLEALGYNTSEGLVRTDSIGVPQRRKRHILVACKNARATLVDKLYERSAEAPRTVEWAIGDLKTLEGHELIDTPSRLSAENKKRVNWLLRNNAYNLPNSKRPDCHRTEHRYVSMYGRLNWSLPAQTITTGFGSPGQGRFLHPDQPRTITPHEAARLQFFPDWYDFSPVNRRTKLQEMIGNAVPPKMSYAIAFLILSEGQVAARNKAAPATIGPVPRVQPIALDNLKRPPLRGLE